MEPNNKISHKSEGFTLVELMVAMFVLAVGVLGGLVMIIVGMTRDNSNRVDTTATNAAQAVMEQIAAVPANTSPTLAVTDCAGNNLAVTTTGSVSPGLGAPLLGNGDIDFGQAAVVGYQMNYTVCGNNGFCPKLGGEVKDTARSHLALNPDFSSH